MSINVYVDGAGGENSGYGFYVKETGDSFYEKKPNIQIIKQNILQLFLH